MKATKIKKKAHLDDVHEEAPIQGASEQVNRLKNFDGVAARYLVAPVDLRSEELSLASGLRRNLSWLSTYFEHFPEYVVGDDLGTSFGCCMATFVVMAAGRTAEANVVAAITTFPLHFVMAVMRQAEVCDLWGGDELLALDRLVANHDVEDLKKLHEHVSLLTVSFWESLTPQAVVGLESLRQGALWGGATKGWCDEESLAAFSM
jgi:hypothetical protein